MSRGCWVIDPATGDLVEAGVYYANLAERRSRCRTGGLTVIADWADPVHAPVGDGYTLTSRADQREMERREGVRCCGDTGHLESVRPPEFKPTTGRRKLLNDLVHGHRPVPEAVKANLEGRTDAPPVFNREALR